MSKLFTEDECAVTLVVRTPEEIEEIHMEVNRHHEELILALDHMRKAPSEKMAMTALERLGFVRLKWGTHWVNGKPITLTRPCKKDRSTFKCSGVPFKAFIYQPFGTQASPDFILISHDHSISTEHKSCDGNAFQLNSGRPEQGVIYIFQRKSDNRSRIMMGEDILNPEDRENFEREWDTVVRRVEKITFSKSVIKSVYPRPAFTLPSTIEVNVIDSPYDENKVYRHIRSL